MKSKEEVRHVAIDDFALLKRENYGTVLIDRETGNYIDFLESRKKEDVIPFLKKYPNIETITRDRAKGYGAAITEVNHNIIQSADYFHLLKNLTDKLIPYLRTQLPYEIKIDNQTIKRYKVEKLLFNKLEDTKLLDNEKKLIKNILQKYPTVNTVLKEVLRFKKIFKSHSIRKFRKIMFNWSNSEINALKTFTKGVYADYEAVENAVRYRITNAIAEGKINKIKTEKRKVYGRCLFDLLTSRLFLSDYFHSIE